MFGKTTEYAIRALVYIYLKNQEGKKPGFREIAQNIGSPIEFTAKVLQNLSRTGMISSMKGRGGGFFFKKDSEELSLFGIISSVETEFNLSRCGFGLNECSDSGPCPLHADYITVRNQLFQLLTTQTIRSLAEKVKRKEAVLTRNQDILNNR